MPVLWTPVWRNGAQFRVNRAECEWCGLSGFHGFFVETGRYTVIQEIEAGGYQYHVRYKERFWDWNSSFWWIQEIFEDFYVTAPGSSTPISPGSVGISFGWLPPHTHQMMFLDNTFISTPQFYFWGMPPAPLDYWNLNGTPAPELPFSYTLPPGYVP